MKINKRVIAGIGCKNEELIIGKTLYALSKFCFKIIIVDDCSTDKTEEIATSKGARVVKQKFLGHIEQKNFAITQAKFPHILSLDADEVLSEELIQSILETKQNWEYDGYTFNRLTYYCGRWIKHCGWYPDAKLRLWDSTKGKWDGLNPHDQFFMQKDASIKHLKGDLFHYSYDSIGHHVMVSQKYSEIMAQQLFDQGIKSSAIKMWINPLAKFIKVYVQKKGFKDGIYGLIISWIAAFSTFMKYAMIRHIEKSEKLKADE
jgi:glycosyltransferase involved in cell wall biosynthesis